jgi:hypothetical protein
MKFKVTKKEMKDNYCKIVKIGYCNAQYLLHYVKPIAYSTRVEGWACDYYDINNVLISTGYAPIESKNTNSNYDIVKSYNDNAREIVNSNKDYKLKISDVNSLLEKFIEKIRS